MTLQIRRRRLCLLADLTHTLGCPCIVLRFLRMATESVLHTLVVIVAEVVFVAWGLGRGTVAMGLSSSVCGCCFRFKFGW